MFNKIQINKNSPIFGIIQGRLSQAPANQLQWFPQNCWRDEFHNAKKLGIDFIELLDENSYNKDNPIWSDSGRSQLKSVSKKTGRQLYSICTDFIMANSLLDDKGNTITKGHVKKLIDHAGELGCKVVVLPLFEESILSTSTTHFFIPIIKDFAKYAAQLNINICIESLLDGPNLKIFLESINESNVGCVFDTGNRVVDNPQLDEEIKLLGDWITHVHIKDKNYVGENVLLGTGLVNFAKVFEALVEIRYEGPLVFETTRGTDPLVTASYHLEICNFFLHEARHGSRV